MKDKLKEIFDVSNKYILITGASGFFGRYISQTFLEVGANIVLMGRSDRLTAQASEYRKKFGKNRAFSYKVDFYKRKAFENTLKKITKRFDIDVLVNNAYDFSEKTGFNTPTGRLEDSTYEQWKSAFESGIYWPALTTKIIGNQFKNKGNGRIINISSMYGFISPNPKLYEGTEFFNPPTYSVYKAGIVGLTRYTASFWGRFGVRCNALLPGPFPNMETKSTNSVKSDNFFLERLKGNTILNKVGHPDDLRGILIYLASGASDFMTGQTIIVDGGWSVT